MSFIVVSMCVCVVCVCVVCVCVFTHLSVHCFSTPQAIRMNSVDGRNYLHKLIMAQNSVNDPLVDFPPSATLEIRYIIVR